MQPTSLDPGRVTRHYEDGSWRRETLAEIAEQRVAEAPDHPSVIDGERMLTRREIFDKASALAGALDASGLKQGDAIGFQLPNWWEACVINLASVLGGFAVVPLLPIYGRSELAHIIACTDPKLIFVPDEFRGTAHLDIARSAGTGKEIVQVRGSAAGHRRFEDMLAGPGLLRTASPDSIKLVMFTSGSTGRPKGVLHTHNTLHSLSRQLQEFWRLGPDDVLLIPSSVAHIGGSIYAFEFPWIMGCTALLMDRWQPDSAVRLIARHGASFCAGATPFLRDLLASARSAGNSLPSLRRFICGGAAVSPGLISEAAEYFSNAVVSRAYGSTEVPTLAPGVSSRAEAAAGAHTDGEIRVELRLLENDEIAVRAPQMFVGYLNPDDNEGAFTADGYFRMGDQGRIVDNRYIEITGRVKDIIIRAGENLSPREIENCLLAHPAVHDVAVVGVPDAHTGEAAFAFVQCRPGKRISLAEVAQHVTAAGLAKQKIPEYLLLVDSFPMSPVGKIQKAALRSEALGLREKAESRR